jgi:two-component system phosphate regulon sensor histidine kinase PhoR
MSSRSGVRTRLSSRFITYYAITYLVMIGLLGFGFDRSARSALLEQVDDSLLSVAQLGSDVLPEEESGYPGWAGTIFDSSGFRTTLITVDGVVLADSHSEPAVMENHLDRPEVQIALTGEPGRDSRISESTGAAQRYLALPPSKGLMVRTSVPTRVIDDALWDVRRSVIVAASALGLFGVVLMSYLARRLARPISELTDQAIAVADGEFGVSTGRSGIEELDQLGLAISVMANRLGSRVSDAEQATATLEVVLGALPQGTILIDPEDRVLYVNSAAHALLGAIPESLSNVAPLQFQNAVREARMTKQPDIRELDHGSPVRRLRGVATPFTSDDRVLLFVMDITERERTDSIRRDFVANASHELKTPVSTIIASTEALQIALARGDPSAAGFAEQIAGSARQLDLLVADLLDLSRLEKETPETAPVRLDSLVRDEVERIRGRSESEGIHLEVTTEQVTAPANHRDLAIATRNLLDNAVRHTAAGGSIEVVVRREGSNAAVSVTDTGEGIPSRDIERVFERFYRVDSARSRGTGGTGLGLSIVKHVAESHGGAVSVESGLGVGSTFTIRLPAAPESEAPTGN